MGEFGRTPYVNPGLGSDERGAYAVERQVSLGDVFATVYKAMGIQWDKEYMTPSAAPSRSPTR